MNTDVLPFNDLRLHEDAVDVQRAIDRVVASGWYVLGPEVEAFEQEFARASGARFAVGVANGTDAITLLLRAAGVEAGDEVIVPAITAAFTGLAVIAAGARPVIVDIDPATLTIDVNSCEAAMTSRVKAIVPVHLYGQPASMRALEQLASRHNILLVEDCCQAHLATAAGRPVGTIGVAGAFSFYPTKNLGALGDGGAVITNDETLASRVRTLRNGGQRTRYVHEAPGVNSRLDELQAAILRARLPRLEAWTARRRALGALYRGALTGMIEVIEQRDSGHVYHLFPVRSRTRDALQRHLQADGIETLVHYPRTLADQPVFDGYRRGETPSATRAVGELLSLPLHPGMRDSDARRVIDAVAGFTPL